MKGDDMKAELTPEWVIEFGKMFEDEIISGLSLEQRLAGLKPEGYSGRVQT